MLFCCADSIMILNGPYGQRTAIKSQTAKNESKIHVTSDGRLDKEKAIMELIKTRKICCNTKGACQKIEHNPIETKLNKKNEKVIQSKGIFEIPINIVPSEKAKNPKIKVITSPKK